ncbi:hypothetical protein CR513_49248, partial [Mucuna pruriens]
MTNSICCQGPWSVKVLPCQSRESVCEGVAEGEEHYFYFYKTLFSKLGITLPFTPFEQAFELLSEDLGWEPSLSILFWVDESFPSKLQAVQGKFLSIRRGGYRAESAL